MVEAFVLNLPDLIFAYPEAFCDHFAGLRNRNCACVLDIDQGLENLLTAVFGRILFRSAEGHYSFLGQ
jgi:hypothetical protein